ncbi:MAG TPA: hemerythrin domain-containing protein [Kofleriaceae bacterium]|jgi:hypothetical protein
MRAALRAAVPTTTDVFEVFTAQHAQIDDLFGFVSSLRDPDALSELADVLGAHLGLEQEALYPHLRAGIVDELRAEHMQIKRVLAQLVWFGVEDPDFATRLVELRELLDGHIGYQEDELFARVAETQRALALAS